jgi:hypothetical protein
MTEITLHYPVELLKDWKLGRLHPIWYRRDMATFCKLDLSNAKNQCRRGFHFGEWFIARHFLRAGYCVLPEKYLNQKRPRALQKATDVLGEDGISYLKRMRRFGGSKLQTSPRPDLLVYKSNLTDFFFVEVKRDADRLSRAQRQFFPMIEEKLGCKVIVVKLTIEK